jgi:hypothetical protein
MRNPPIAPVLGLLLALAPLARAESIDRHFGYDASRVHVSTRGDYTAVDVTGGVREFQPGRPDLPWVSESVDLPAGMRVARVQVLGVTTAPLASGARLASSIQPRPGLGNDERTAPDARYFGPGAPVQPEERVVLGVQGGMRGRTLATLRVSPVTWNPATGELRIVTGLDVRLELERDPDPPLHRERIVPEWEDGNLGAARPTADAATAMRAAGAAGARRPTAPFRAEQVPSVLGSPVQYVIVTSDAMAPAFQQLADWKTQAGVPAVVRTISFIRAQYPSGADDGERIRNFLRDAYTRWGTKWALLGGDTDVIPARQAFCNWYLPDGEYIASDMYYACLDGNWNANGNSIWGEGGLSPSNPGDAADLMPELYVGRASVTTLADAQTFVNKTLQYERTPLGTYESNWMFAAEVLFPQPWVFGNPTQMDGADLADGLLSLTDGWPNLHVARLYENYPSTHVRPGSVPENRQAVIDSLNRGYGLTLHIGHGYRNVMEVGDASLTNTDAMALTNGNKLTNLYAINCTSSAIDFPCIAESFLLNPNGGAVTSIGSTRFDFPSTGDGFQHEYFRLFLNDSVNAVGELAARQKLPYLGYSSVDGVNRWTTLTLILLGDPELRMWLGSPRTLTVSAPFLVTLADTQVTVHVESAAQPVRNARVTAYRAGHEFVSGLTNASGDLVLPFRADSVGGVKLTVTAWNARPFQTSMVVVSSSTADVVRLAPVLDDGSGAGTVGDANGSLDAGETVDVTIPLTNRGGTQANAVTASITSTDGLANLITPSASYGDIAPGATAGPAAGFRVSFPYTTPDQREVPFTLTVLDANGDSWHQAFSLLVHAPEPHSYTHVESEPVGNGNGRPDVGETVDLSLRVRNDGTAVAHGVSLVVRSYDGLTTITDSTSVVGDLAPGASALGDPVEFTPNSPGGVLDVIVSTANGPIGTQRIDFTYPVAPVGLLGVGAASTIALSWTPSASSDLYGYLVYRSSVSAGPYTAVTAVPTGRTAIYTDGPLTSLTKYWYKVSAVDSSGNESPLSTAASASTNPPTHGIYPVPTGQNTPAPIALEYVYGPNQMDIAAGSDVLYMLHADGSAPVDADGSGATQGDFTTRGHYYAAGPSLAVLEPGKGMSVVGATWDSAGIYVYDKNGAMRPGFPVRVDAPVWSGVACGDLDGDGKMEMCFGSNGNNFYAFHSDGTELIDGDNNPATLGVFHTFGWGANYGTPALADLDGDGLPEIIYGGYDGAVYAWKPNGTLLPGFPFQTNGAIKGSVAVGYLDGPGDTQPEIVFMPTNDSVYVIEPNGTRRPGWPSWNRTGGNNSKTPSPALADMNNDGYLDIVFQSPNGLITCYNRDGSTIPGLTAIRYSSLTSSASECSPVVADINGDGWNDIIVGDENGQLNAISGADGSILPGFPIQLAGEVRGTPAVGDIDGDGKTEIAVAGWDKNIYVWDYDFPFQPQGKAPWPQFHHDARRTGFASAPLFLGVGDDGPLGNGAVTSLEFAPPSPNPANTSSRMWFAIPSGLGGTTYELSIYDLGGRRVRLVDSGIARPGRFSLAWNLRDESGHPVQGGVYFARMTVGGHSRTNKLVVVP